MHTQFEHGLRIELVHGLKALGTIGNCSNNCKLKNLLLAINGEMLIV